MVRARSPSHGPQRFETRYGECTIEQGTLRSDQGISRLFRRYVMAAKDRDLGALGKGAAVVVGFALTTQQAVEPLLAGAEAVRGRIPSDPVTSALAVLALVAALYPLVRRWYVSHGPVEIRCSDIRSVEQDEQTFRIEYKDGPRTRTRTIKTPRDDFAASNRAREAFEEKGFEIER